MIKLMFLGWELYIPNIFFDVKLKHKLLLFKKKKIEAAMDKSGIPGKPCVLRAICELTETPIHHWSVFGEMLTNLLRWGTHFNHYLTWRDLAL